MYFTQESITEGTKILINKELYWTSFDVVKKVRYGLQHKFKIKKLKVGHAGTLDPLATGLMIICTGKATKQIDQIQNQTKRYNASIKLGETTPSFDLETSVDHQYPIQHISKPFVIEMLNKFTGEIEQIPPVFSAIKHEGKRAYEFARKGESIELKAKKIHIYQIDLVHFELPNLVLDITCSKGTYIRSLARDIGFALNSGAHLTNLCRTAIGEYRISEAIKIKDFENYLFEL